MDRFLYLALRSLWTPNLLAGRVQDLFSFQVILLVEHGAALETEAREEPPTKTTPMTAVDQIERQLKNAPECRVEDVSKFELYYR